MSAYGFRHIGVLLLTMLLSACAATAGGGSTSSKSMPEVLNDARRHPERRTVIIADCENAISTPPATFLSMLFLQACLTSPRNQAATPSAQPWSKR